MQTQLSLLLINGLATGGIYAILAAGFALVFGIARFANMAHTGLYMLAGFVMYIVIVVLGLNLWLGFLLGILAAIAVAMIFYVLVLDRVKQQPMAVMILTLALVMLMQEVLLIFFHAYLRGLPPIFDGFVEIIGVRISQQHIFTIIVCAVVLTGLILLLLKTRLGNAIRAVSQDAEIANVMGINVGQILLITMAISAGLAGIAAVVIVPLYSIQPYMWLDPLVIIIAAVVLGGLGSVKGSIIGAFILGFAEIIVVTFLPEGGFLKGVISLLVMVVVLMVKPEGLFGIVFEEERL